MLKVVVYDRCEFCNGTSACLSVTITCPDKMACDVLCDGENSCRGLNIVCASDGPCSLFCGNDSACQDAKLICGNEKCNADCDGSSPKIIMECGDSCDCNNNCLE